MPYQCKYSIIRDDVMYVKMWNISQLRAILDVVLGKTNAQLLILYVNVSIAFPVKYLIN
jgi:hypothetical protein